MKESQSTVAYLTLLLTVRGSGSLLKARNMSTGRFSGDDPPIRIAELGAEQPNRAAVRVVICVVEIALHFSFLGCCWGNVHLVTSRFGQEVGVELPLTASRRFGHQEGF
jgi:hypothetical protein